MSLKYLARKPADLRRRAIQCGPLFALMLLPLPALAQSQQEVLEEIIVTAQRREQSVTDLSMSVTVFTGEFIEKNGLSQPVDLAQYTPGLTVATTNGDANPIFSVRGVGQLDYPANSSPAVSVYVNEIFLPSHAMLGFQLFDLERVEVLKGPQGTLYGRNTTGGAINFITRKPEVGEPLSGSIRLRYGTYNTYEIEGALGFPVTDNMAGRLAVVTKQRNEGYQFNRFDGTKHGELDRLAMRSLLAWVPTDGLHVLFNFHRGWDESDNQYYDFHGFADPVTFGPCATRLEDNPNGCVDLFGNAEPESSPFNVSVNPLFGSFIDSDAMGGSITVNWERERLTVTSVTGYNEFERVLTEDFDASPAIQFDDSYENKIRAFSEELRLTSDESWPVAWIVGLYYSQDFVKNFSLFALDDFGSGRLDSRWEQTTRSLALFSNFQWPLSEHWDLIGGLRFTDEKKEFVGGSGLGTVDTAFALSFTDADIAETDLSGEFGVEFRPNDDWLFYGKFSRGFKSGGYDGGFSSSDDELIPVKPEVVYAVEVGLKATMFNRAMQLNGAAYFFQWDDFQSQISLFRGGIPQLVLGNAGDAEIAGVETSLLWRPTETLFIAGGINYFAKAEIVRSLDATLVGNVTPNTPDLTANGMIRYAHPMVMMGNSVNTFVQTSFSWKDSVFFEVANRDAVAAESYGLWNAQFGVTALDDRLEIAAWGHNLGDEEYRVGGNTGADFTADVFYYGMPRTIGLSLSYRFE